MAYLLRKRTLLNNDETYMFIHVCRSASKNGTLVQKQVASYKLSQLLLEHKDPQAFLESKLQEYKDSEKIDDRISVSLDLSYSNKVLAKQKGKKGIQEIKDTDGAINLGYLPYLHLFHQLEIDYFLNNRRRYTKCDYNLNTLFQHLIYSRCLFPSSKLAFEGIKQCFGMKVDYQLQDIYRGMDYFLKWRKDLLLHLNTMMKKKYGRESLLFYYDVTNYYFEIDENDVEDPNQEDSSKLSEDCKAAEVYGLRHTGPSKEHRKTPIVQMGLFMDNKGLPVSYELFSGNTIDVETLEPMMDESIIDFKDSTKIIVADKGMMSFDNISRIRIDHNGYIISQSVKKGGQEIQSWVLDESDFEDVHNSDGELLYRIKERITPRDVRISSRDDESLKRDEKKHQSDYNERQICIYSEHYAKKAAHEREELINKALSRVGSRSKDSKDSSYGTLKFLKKVPKKDHKKADVDSYAVELDQDAIDEDAKYDGYYVICTNVLGLTNKNKPMKKEFVYDKDGFLILNREVTAKNIYEMYGGLWKIEETFKVSKTSGLRIRPIFHRKDDRIRAHFLICFVSLLIERLLEYNFNWKYSSMYLKKSLSRLNGIPINDLNLYAFSYYNEVIDSVANYLQIDLDKNIVKRDTIKQMIAKCKKID